MIGRLFRHVLFPHRRLRKAFPEQTLAAIEHAVKEAERGHLGEIRFAVESALEPGAIWHGQGGRARAVEVFAELHVWDTERNNGVLIYVLLADHDVEIVADRGIARHIDQQEWRNICQTMEQAFAREQFEAGSIAAVQAVSALLARHFPAEGENVNELPNRPHVF
jgi:uncharacterized membrane protein